MSGRLNSPVVAEPNSRDQRRPLQPQPRTAVDRLAERIPALCNASGALPPQAMLAQALGVSRPLVREAVSQLVARGVVEVRTRVGSRVVDERQWRIVDPRVVGWRLARAADSAFVADIAEVRRLLEPVAAADAARHASPEQRARITAASATRLGTNSLLEYASARRELHVSILAASPNQFLQQLTCLVFPLDPSIDPRAGAPTLGQAERQALARFEAAIRSADASAAREGIERLNEWDLPRLDGLRGAGQ